MSKDNFDFERFKEEAMKGLYEGKKMGGTDGVFAPMLKHLLESMLDGELEHHLQENKVILNWRAAVTVTAHSSLR